MTDLLVIAERCETAKGADYELNGDILRAIGLPTEFMGQRVTRWHDADNGSLLSCTTSDGVLHYHAAVVPAYSSSIDAARALVPVGFGWDCGEGAGGPTARVYDPLRKAEHTATLASTRSAALALCSAALRARAALTK